MKPFDGFSDFMAVHVPALSRLAYLLTGNHADAQDLVQSALTKTASHWRRVVKYDDPAAYVRRVMINESTSRWRRRQRIKIDPVMAVPDRAQPDGTGRSVARVVLWQALGRLTARQRAMLVLRFYEDRSVDETATLLGCSGGAVKSETHHALARLRALVPELAELEALS
jgi:RNA polymerase sigma-70 factor (sigma-E family)